MMKRGWACVWAVCALACGLSPWAQADGVRGAEAVDFVEITPETARAIEQGLRYLASSQQDDGSWGSSGYGRHAGITALCCMAFMAEGHLPGRGPYGDVVSRGLDFVLDHSSASGLIAADTSHGPMYGHGFATLFLGEVYGMTGDERCREALLKAVRLIVDAQNDEGGWRYQPTSLDADISVTICQIMALRSARNAGVIVPTDTMDRAIEYVRGCQNAGDGGFSYMLGGGGSAFPRSAAGVAALYYAGVYEGENIERGLGYLTRFANNMGNAGGHFHYGHYYAVQAMYQAGGESWATWYPAIRDYLLNDQNSNGGWGSPAAGDAYGTAMSLLILEMPNRLLPIYQR